MRDASNVLQILEETAVGHLETGSGWGGAWQCFSDEVCPGSVFLGRAHDGRLVSCVRDSSGELLHKWTPEPTSGWCLEDWAEGTPDEPSDAHVTLAAVGTVTMAFTVSRGKVFHAEWGPGAAMRAAAWRAF